MKRFLTIASLLLVFAEIAFIFWYSEWRYNLPTPVPGNYKVVKQAEIIDISRQFSTTKQAPVFLHFFNPDCPCSKFNIPHFKTLAKRYAEKISFAVVVMSNKKYTAKNIQEKFGLSVPVLFDTTLAATCGVYSTPQAVLLNVDHALYYRGNYNRNRYCTDEKSNYAQMAIDSLLQKKQDPAFNQYALTAYGCSLPVCTK